MRKLATIRIIDDILPIPEADAIECAVIGGWKIVVRKNEYKINDLVIYCEIDSFIPTEIAPFLTKPDHFPKEYEGIKGERLKTVKLRGQLSQGLILPIEIALARCGGYVEEDQDVTEVLGILKWEAPISAQLAGTVKGNFLTEIPKTDEERIQNLKRDLENWINLGYNWEVTEKLDGTSVTYYLDLDGNFRVCSRNLELKMYGGNTYWKVAIKEDLEKKMKENKLEGMAIQGEIIGEGIQKNRYNLRGQFLYVYKIYDVKAGKYLNPDQRRFIIAQLGLNHVPVITPNFKLPETIDHILKLAEGKSEVHLHTEREGLVFKCNEIDQSFKSISNKYLCKIKE